MDESTHVPDELLAPEPVESELNEPPAWLILVWDTLRLLPPLLALPMFVVAYRSPRRPRREK